MNYLGIDVSKKSHRIVILDEEGELLAKSFSIESTQEGFNFLFKKLNSLNLAKDNLLCGLEATGNLWENIYSFLTNAHFKVIVLNPFRLINIINCLPKRQKLTISPLWSSLDFYVPKNTLIPISRMT